MSQTETKKQTRMEFFQQLHASVVQHWNMLILSGEMLTVPAFMERGGLSKEELEHAKRNGKVFVVEGPDGAQYCPAFLIDGRLSKEIPAVLQEITDFLDIEKWLFFSTVHPRLHERTPLAALIDGDVDQVMQIAATTSFPIRGSGRSRRSGIGKNN